MYACDIYFSLAHIYSIRSTSGKMWFLIFNGYKVSPYNIDALFVFIQAPPAGHLIYFHCLAIVTATENVRTLHKQHGVLMQL